jgi:hypothetical protein
MVASGRRHFFPLVLLTILYTVIGCSASSQPGHDDTAAMIVEIMGGSSSSKERSLRRQDDQNFAIVECMKAQGFEREEFEGSLITSNDFRQAAAQQDRLAERSRTLGMSYDEYYAFGVTTKSLPIEFEVYGLRTGVDSIETLNGRTRPTSITPSEAVFRALHGPDGC